MNHWLLSTHDYPNILQNFHWKQKEVVMKLKILTNKWKYLTQVI